MSTVPCDIMVCDSLARNLLPRMRAEMVYRLVSDQGITQSEVAKRLGVSRAAISQYMSRKRGGGSGDLSPDLNDMVNLWAEAVMRDDVTITLCDVCRCARNCRWNSE
ncbi:MAG: helix-turn-helix domain-containing protein [Methanomicrobiaceae archaeon]|nr:helix-turn-helix domain-containing protein [Methanomicrobiaceae archaeon]